MSTANLVTVLQTAVTDLTTALTDVEGFIAIATASGAPGSHDTPSSTQVNAAIAARQALNTALQLLDDERFESGSAIDAVVTIS